MKPCPVKVLFFTASWCGPCKAMKSGTLPALHRRRKEAGLAELQIIKIDVDDKEPSHDASHVDGMAGKMMLSGYALAERFNILSMPTFVFLKADASLQDQEIHRVVSTRNVADFEREIEKAVLKWAKKEST